MFIAPQPIIDPAPFEGAEGILESTSLVAFRSFERSGGMAFATINMSLLRSENQRRFVITFWRKPTSAYRPLAIDHRLP